MQFIELNTEIKVGKTKITYHKIQKRFSAEGFFFVLIVLAKDTACAVVVGFV